MPSTAPNGCSIRYNRPVFTLIDLGDGSFLLTPRISQINRLGNRVAEILDEGGVSLEDLLSTLDEERERYYQEHYASGISRHENE